MGKKSDDVLSDQEAETRAADALRRALTTPYRPQKELVGKSGRPPKRNVKKKNRAKR